MQENHNQRNRQIPSELSKRIEMVIAACIHCGHVNRQVIADYYNIHQLEASTLLRDFIQHRVHDVRWDAKTNSYTLVGYPTKGNPKPQS